MNPTNHRPGRHGNRATAPAGHHRPDQDPTRETAR